MASKKTKKLYAVKPQDSDLTVYDYGEKKFILVESPCEIKKNTQDVKPLMKVKKSRSDYIFKAHEKNYLTVKPEDIILECNSYQYSENSIQNTYIFSNQSYSEIFKKSKAINLDEEEEEEEDEEEVEFSVEGEDPAVKGGDNEEHKSKEKKSGAGSRKQSGDSNI